MKFAANNPYKVSPISVIYLGSPHIPKPHALALYHCNWYKKQASMVGWSVRTNTPTMNVLRCYNFNSSKVGWINSLFLNILKACWLCPSLHFPIINELVQTDSVETVLECEIGDRTTELKVFFISFVMVFIQLYIWKAMNWTLCISKQYITIAVLMMEHLCSYSNWCPASSVTKGENKMRSLAVNLHIIAIALPSNLLQWRPSNFFIICIAMNKKICTVLLPPMVVWITKPPIWTTKIPITNSIC